MISNVAPPPNMETEPDPIKALKIYYEFFTSTGTDALVELDAALSSYSLYLANWSVFFDSCWLLYGTDLVWNTPWSVCKSSGLVFMRLRVTLFQTLFIIYLLQMVMFASGQLMKGDAFAVKMLNMADQYDHFLGMGFPIAKILCHALVVRHSGDMLAIQLNMQKTERERWQEKKLAAEAKLKEITYSYDAADLAIADLEQEKTALPFGEVEEEMHAHLEEVQAKIKKDSAEFAKQFNEQSIKATENAEALLEQWERGEGGELMQGFSQAAGLDRAGEMLGQLNTSDVIGRLNIPDQELLQAGLAQAQAAADNAQQAINEANGNAESAGAAATSTSSQPIPGAAGPEDAAGGAPSAAASQPAPPAPVAKATMPAALRRPSQADEGAGGPSIPEIHQGGET